MMAQELVQAKVEGEELVRNTLHHTLHSVSMSSMLLTLQMSTRGEKEEE